MSTHPRYLSLGAGVQSSVVLLLAARGEIPPFDAAVFAVTGWEPTAVYDHLDHLERIAASAGIPVVRVSAGNIRADALDPAHRFASMPLFTLGPNGERGMARRQISTNEYKIRPIKAEVRRRLGYPHPQRVPAGIVADMAIGISLDEVHRARDADVGYMRNVFPLLDLGWRRSDCMTYLEQHGLSGVGKSSCLGFHDDGFWAALRDGSPAEWAGAVAFDAAIRHGSARAADGHPLRGQFFLHRRRVPLDHVTFRPKPTAVHADDAGDGEVPGCGPWTCPHPSEAVTEPIVELAADVGGVREVA
ncbi:hypothetical protein [Dactylosporangium matsuzakiense]|uniref:Uncharacterized protein n=1 Tax=Dactylosporangium matsuzakiense TaxID=53360 RepID=A0A9W6KPJ0_9ACTN|nr:hypothetical protein [Dactylosporangium matsuzakiense]GLL04680.1 hypothetical protein GCM10017581_064270 [Dactylosporangium matsuzakiense]